MARILLIDPATQRGENLGDQLAPSGHHLTCVPSGEEGVERAAAEPFDLVVLDLLLAGRLHGFETAARLSRMPGNDFLPILVVTALGDPSSRILAFRSGVDDYLTRPVDVIELRARVDSLLARRREREQLLRLNADLMDLHLLKAEMAGLLVKDAETHLATISKSIDEIERGALTRAQLTQRIADARLATAGALRLFSNLVTVSGLEAARLSPTIEPVAIGALVREVLEPRRAVIAERRVVVEVDDRGVIAEIDRQLVGRALETLIDHALRRVADGGTIVVRAERGGRGVQLRVGDDGPPLTTDQRERLLDRGGGGDPGLGFHLCRVAVQAHRGYISIAEEPRLPTIFVIDLPTL